MRKSLISAVAFLVLGTIGFLGFLHWNVNRVYVPEGSSLMLRYKGPLLFGTRSPATPGHFAEKGQIGVREQMCGPGRHFYCPIWWKRTIVPDQVVEPGQVAIVTSKLGDSLPNGEFLVDGDLSGENRASHKGIIRKVFGPGRYRANPYAFEFNIINRAASDAEKPHGWVEIPTGYVGVVTYLADNKVQGRKRGIQDKVLPPGLYPINPREQNVDIVEIGFRETSITVEQIMKGGVVAHDESGEPLAVPGSGIGFPSNDGFDIQMDFTAIWGVMPVEAPEVIRTFGSVQEAERKVIQPQSESICRNNGSKMSAVDLLVGETRQQFQVETSDAFKTVLRDKNMTLLYGLVRHIYIPREVRIPIQEGYIADELKITREEEQTTAKIEANLKEAEKKVELESERVTVETEKIVANAVAEGEREAREIGAETARKVAQIQRQIAELDAKREVMMGQAEADAQQLLEEAKAEKFDLAVHAFGNPGAYSKWEFAEGLPEDIDLKLFYAGEGTLWTDLKGVMPTIPVAEPASGK
jgi:hypothetical protein